MKRREFLHAFAGTAAVSSLFPSDFIPGLHEGLGFQLIDVTAQAGISFKHNSGAYGGKLLPETLGSGCAFLDYDADGWQDILLVNAMDLDLAGAIKNVAAGKTVLDPQVAKPQALKGERETGLTPREMEILQHIVAGKSNKEIASDLELSVNTVAVHRANIMDRLGIHKTAELVVYAIRNGLVNLP